jgi:hypothetical protein
VKENSTFMQHRPEGDAGNLDFVEDVLFDELFALIVPL